ncbi:MAG: Crp/Fnr family transcriptional regulator [Lachnospiraceae bacterium]|nr:Crp/Fnr family transcriptional regulator [Lachnospiraceae bacterium]MCI9334575.1 Crp/Fnr family transcriptional regulator [Lachnospiraceae bacterium]
MKKIYDRKRIQEAVSKCKYKELLESLPLDLFLIEYEPGELVSAPWLNHSAFQFVLSGELSICFIRDDGSLYSLASERGNYILGDMDLFDIKNNNIYAEVTKKLTSIAFITKNHREVLLQSSRFLYFAGEAMARKIEMISALEAAPSSLQERVISYMKFKCEEREFKGIEKTAFRLHCSARQLQRVLNDCEKQGLVVKTGKGAYKLTNQGAFHPADIGSPDHVS